MRKIDVNLIKEAVKEAFSDICCNVDIETVNKLKESREKEINSLAAFNLDIMLENIKIASCDSVAACQDTGMAVVFLEIGQEVFLENGDLIDAVNQGVRVAYSKKFRKSVLDPIDRINSKDNTPAVIHTSIIKGDKVKVSCMAKGFGSENMSALKMLNPSDGVEGIVNFAIDTVKKAGGCPCPPVIVGVGIGGTMEKAAMMSKHSLLREVNSSNLDTALDELEKRILKELNLLNIGAGGFGGNTTALAVFIEKYHTHIAGLPVAVTIQCHCNRHKSIEI